VNVAFEGGLSGLAVDVNVICGQRAGKVVINIRLVLCLRMSSSDFLLQLVLIVVGDKMH